MKMRKVMMWRRLLRVSKEGTRIKAISSRAGMAARLLYDQEGRAEVLLVGEERRHECSQGVCSSRIWPFGHGIWHKRRTLHTRSWETRISAPSTARRILSILRGRARVRACILSRVRCRRRQMDIMRKGMGTVGRDLPRPRLRGRGSRVGVTDTEFRLPMVVPVHRQVEDLDLDPVEGRDCTARRFLGNPGIEA